MELNRILQQLAARGLRYRELKATGKPGRPEAISLEVTRRCIARCLMCNIWQMPETSPELEADQWLRTLQSPILSELKELDVTGGEPFLRDDLSKLLLGIGTLKVTSLPHLCSVAITTNGFLTAKIMSDVSAAIGPLEQAGVTLVFACGMDAVGDTHDHIRNYPGGWAKLHATIEGLKELRTKHPTLVLGIKTTITRHNIVRETSHNIESGANRYARQSYATVARGGGDASCTTSQHTRHDPNTQKLCTQVC